MSDIQFSKEELERYSRHLIIPEFNIEGQKKLKAAKILVVGAGGLGAPVLQYLTAAGIGEIGIVDDDIVSQSNLQRQVLFTGEDVGKLKVEIAVQRLEKLNSNVKVTTYPIRINSENALEIAQSYDLIVDGTDNFPTRYLLNDTALILGIPYVYGSIYKFEGQVAVFNFKSGSENPVNYRDLFAVPPLVNQVPSCSEGGVLGVLPGIIGSMQANEVIKIITGLGEILSGKLLVFDALSMESRIIQITANPDLPEVKELIDYDEFCNSQSENETAINEIDAFTLNKWIESEDIQIIDCREPFEHAISEIESELIPQDQILDRISEISKEKKVVVYCRSGKRSAEVISKLQSIHGFENLYNLKGGILDWAEKIDSSQTKY